MTKRGSVQNDLEFHSFLTAPWYNVRSNRFNFLLFSIFHANEGSNAVNLAKRLLKAGALSPEKLGQALIARRSLEGFWATISSPWASSSRKRWPSSSPLIRRRRKPSKIWVCRKIFLAQLLLKHAFFTYSFTARDMSEALKIPEHLVELLIVYLTATGNTGYQPPGTFYIRVLGTWRRTSGTSYPELGRTTPENFWNLTVM